MRKLMAKVSRLVPMRRAQDRDTFARFMREWAEAQAEVIAKAQAAKKGAGQ